MKKTLILLAALAFATAGTSFAQTTPAPAVTNMKMKDGKGPKKDKLTPAQKADKGAAKMAKELGLSPDQETRVEQILLARQQEMRGLKEKAGADRKATHEQMKTVRAKYDTQLQGTLSAEQFAKYEKLRAEHKGHGGHHGHGPQDGKMKVKSKG